MIMRKVIKKSLAKTIGKKQQNQECNMELMMITVKKPGLLSTSFKNLLYNGRLENIRLNVTLSFRQCI